jgi:hypothetical protein
VVDRDQRPKIRLSIKPAVSAPVDTTPVDGGWEEATEDVEPEPDQLQVTDIGTGPPRKTAVPGEPPRGSLESETNELRRGIQAPSPTKRRRDDPGRSILQSSVGEAVIVDEASIDIEAPVRAPPPMRTRRRRRCRRRPSRRHRCPSPCHLHPGSRCSRRRRLRSCAPCDRNARPCS